MEIYLDNHDWCYEGFKSGCGQANLHLSIYPKGKPLGSHVVGQKHYVLHLDTPTTNGRTTMVGCTRNEVLGRSPI